MKMNVSMSLDELHQIVLDALNFYGMKIEGSHVNEREKVMYFSLVSDAGAEDLRDADWDPLILGDIFQAEIIL